MAVFTVHAPAGAANADATVFVREGFSWSAFSFGPLWLLWNRLWLAFGLWLVWIVALGAAGERRRTEWLGGGWIGDALAADNYLFEVT